MKIGDRSNSVTAQKQIETYLGRQEGTHGPQQSNETRTPKTNGPIPDGFDDMSTKKKGPDQVIPAMR